ncbi:MAG: Dyp-type peroxidase, partial [Planctomycetes bacterium]|nr:Dyp-type peroxidase [Planctomycetota bacterium]
MNTPQPGILLPPPPLARFLTIGLRPAADSRDGLRTLREIVDGEHAVVGLGLSLVRAMKGGVEGLRAFPPLSHAGVEIPSTPCDLWVWLRGTDRGELFHQSRGIERALGGAFHVTQTVDAFQYLEGRDLTGYVDGTENPTGERAEEVAIVHGRGKALEGSSFVAAQQWVHQFDAFEAMPSQDQDHSIGRRRSTNEEIAAAPASAHIRRTAQESFNPPAFILRRSMPWTAGQEGGLMFVAFGASLDPFEALLRRMIGLEDGVVDSLFRFTRPVTGGYYWCPAMREGGLDLSLLGVQESA